MKMKLLIYQLEAQWWGFLNNIPIGVIFFGSSNTRVDYEKIKVDRYV
jgi:hypothetical protein